MNESSCYNRKADGLGKDKWFLSFLTSGYTIRNFGVKYGLNIN